MYDVLLDARYTRGIFQLLVYFMMQRAWYVAMGIAAVMSL